MSWTPEREEKLKELWKKGHSGSHDGSIQGLVNADVDDRRQIVSAPQSQVLSNAIEYHDGIVDGIPDQSQ